MITVECEAQHLGSEPEDYLKATTDSDSCFTKIAMTNRIGEREAKTNKIKCEILKNKPDVQLNNLLMIFNSKLKVHIN